MPAETLQDTLTRSNRAIEAGITRLSSINLRCIGAHEACRTQLAGRFIEGPKGGGESALGAGLWVYAPNLAVVTPIADISYDAISVGLTPWSRRKAALLAEKPF